jgi:phosphatidylglycerophosphatase A
MFKKFNILFVTFFYIGKIKVAPGTFASFFTCILMFFLINLISFLTLYIFTFLIFLYSLYAIKNVLVLFKEKDPKDIVIDEFIGQALPLLLIPIYELYYPNSHLYYFILSFLTFRFFDIFKPFPINYIDKKLKNELGIMLDDIVAGVYSAVLILCLSYIQGIN